MEAVKFLAIATMCFVMIITTCTPANSTNYVKPPAIAKLNCSSKCGEVKIPFPFGIGWNCSADKKWFEIECRNNTNSNSTMHTSSKPFLKSIPQVEVMSISIENGTLQVANSPIQFFDCPDKEHSQSIKTSNLSGSPFSFSDSHNRLTVVGCNDFGYIDQMSPGDVKNIREAGCTAFCPNNTQISNSNSSNSIIGVINDATGYCQTIIPSYLNSYDIQLQRNKGDKRCTYVFLGDQDWFERSGYDFETIYAMEYLPMVLNWDLLEYNDNKANHSNSRQCYPADATSSIDGQRFQCVCRDGYEGNPYLFGGCEDIDECLGNNLICPEKNTTCVNTPGKYNCEPKTTVRKIHQILIGVSSGLGALVFIFGACSLFKLIKRREDIKRKEKFFKKNGGLLLQQQICSMTANVEGKTKVFNSKELEKATNRYNANRILGQGGQGTVYKGMLEDGKIVAVKKSKLEDKGKVTEFINEVVILSQINHRNVVKLLGCCLETEVPLLVYEFIPNGTLYHYIHDKNEEFQLTWEIRSRIATEVAEALSYLHFAASIPIYHRDIKSTNILLDDKYRAKVADFGTSKSISEDQTHVTTRVSGTFGYMDPEYFQTSQFTEKSDVYSFGVVIVELLSGQKPVSLTDSRKRNRSLATYFIQCMEENHLFDIVDPVITNEGCNESIRAVANLAYRCLNLVGKNRPTMKEVATELVGLRESLKVHSSDHDQIFEKAAHSRPAEVPDQPWELFSTTSIGSGPCSTSTTGAALSLDTATLSSFNTSS